MTIVVVEKQKVMRIMSVFVVAALVIQHAKRMRRIILSFDSCLPLSYFSTLSYKRHDFRKKILNIKYVLTFNTTFI